MIEYFKSVNNKYTYDNDKYLKNEISLIKFLPVLVLVMI